MLMKQFSRYMARRHVPRSLHVVPQGLRLIATAAIAIALLPAVPSTSGASPSPLGTSCKTLGATIGAGPGVTLICMKKGTTRTWQRQVAPVQYQQGRYSTNALIKGKALANGVCSGAGTIPLSHAPMDVTNVGVIEPMGLMVYDHVIPVAHEYYYGTDPNAPANSYPVYATASGVLDAIGVNYHNGPDPLPAWYVTLSHTCTFFSQYNLLTSLSPEVMAALPAGWSARHSGNVHIHVTAGEVIGYDGGQSLDFSVIDTAATNSGYLNPTAYNNFDAQYVNTVAPYGYFTPAVQSQILSKYERTSAPIDGQIGYDVKGEAVGNWFVAGNVNINDGLANPNGTQGGFLSLSYNYVDPTAQMLSIANYQGQPTQFVVTNAIDWTKITAASGPVAIELATPSYQPSSSGSTVVKGIKLVASGPTEATALIQLTGPEDMKFEMFPGLTPAQVTGFTSSAQHYDRGQHAKKQATTATATNG